MLLLIIIALLLVGNWFFTESLVYLPVNLIYRFASFSWWTLAILGIIFLAWCIGED